MKVTIKSPNPEQKTNLFMVKSTGELGVYCNQSDNLVCLYLISTHMGHAKWVNRSDVEQLAVGTTLEVVL